MKLKHQFQIRLEHSALKPFILLTYTHSSKHNGKIFFTVIHHIFGFLHQASLATDLSCNLEGKKLQCTCTFDEEFKLAHFLTLAKMQTASAVLRTALNTHLIVGQTSSREYGDFLPPGNAVHTIYCRNASLNHLFWIDSTLGIDWLTC